MEELQLTAGETVTTATSREHLATLLGVSVSTIARALASKKSPGKKQNGSYDVAAWRDWLAHGRKDPSPDGKPADNAWDLRRRKMLAAVQYEEARALRERVELEARKGSLVEAVKVRQANAAAVEALRVALVKDVGACARDSAQYDAIITAIDRSFNVAANAVESLAGTPEKEQQ